MLMGRMNSVRGRDFCLSDFVDMGSVDGKNEFCERERFLSF